MKDSQKILNMYFATHKTCNLNCTYCYIPESYKKIPRPSDADIISSLMEFIIKVESEGWRIGKFCLHGAEPTLLEPESLAEIVHVMNNHWNKYGCKNKVAIQSNGIRLDREYLKRLLLLLDGKPDIKLGFSIDPPKAIHDKYRNNSFDKVEQNLFAARELGFFTSILSVITKDTLLHLNDFADWLKKESEKMIKNKNPYKIKVKFATGAESPDENDMLVLADFFVDNDLAGLLQALSPGYCIQSGNECLWFEFDAEGNCYSCNKKYFGDGIFADWQNESFGEIYEKRIGLYNSAPVHIECGSCEFEYICNSGCPADRQTIGDNAGKAHDCILIKRIIGVLSRNNINIIDFINNN
ncbi:MAG: Protein containing Radical domain [Bacteroidota bacterium]|nr:Protein containing Radical domain [Bacteroidota bacterium]